MASLSSQREGASQAGLDMASPPNSFVLDRRKREEHRCFRGSFLLDKGRVNAKGLGKNSGFRNLEKDVVNVSSRRSLCQRALCDSN